MEDHDWAGGGPILQAVRGGGGDSPAPVDGVPSHGDGQENTVFGKTYGGAYSVTDKGPGAAENHLQAPGIATTAACSTSVPEPPPRKTRQACCGGETPRIWDSTPYAKWEAGVFYRSAGVGMLAPAPKTH